MYAIEKTIQATIDQLNAMAPTIDNGKAHYTANRLLLALLDDLGQGEVVKAFKEADDRVGFWYS